MISYFGYLIGFGLLYLLASPLLDWYPKNNLENVWPPDKEAGSASQLLEEMGTLRSNGAQLKSTPDLSSHVP